ncbi:MAG: glycine cleavage system aminomethyltransferase GcvT [Phycisphaerales bacterium]|nr:glycine cleavage system aminomethyltransferase GcvT [Phycisphaerales bacterium]
MPRERKGTALLRTPLYDFHVEHGGKMVDFAGWEMPMLYAKSGGILAEHHQVRKSGGIFDVSHMGRVKMTGRHARRLLERLCTRRISDMQEGQCRYSLVCNEQGGIRDDVIVYKNDEDDFLVVVNASNREKLLGHFEQVRAAGDLNVKIDDQTLKTAMVALQGPRVMPMIAQISKEIPALKRYRFAVKNLVIMKLIVSRTGYTGEDGVEVILPASGMEMALKLLLKDVKVGEADALVKPAGLGARDTLRLEAGMPLYGHELGEETNALGTTLDFAVSLDKDADERGEKFIGMEALKRTRDEGGPAQKLVGIRLEGKRTARQGMTVKVGGKQVGTITSACLSPTLGYPIAMAYIGRDHAAEGTALEIDTGKDALLPGQVCAMPFYKMP